MAWFAVDARWTRSLRWLYASRAARFGWYALAELANELRTPGIIPDAQGRDREVADAARIRVTELRACMAAGLAHYGDDGALRLEGWVNVAGNEPPRSESAAPLPPKRSSQLTDAQRAQRRAAGQARAAAAGRSAGAFAGGDSDDIGDGARAAVAARLPAEPTSGASGAPAERTSGAPAKPTSGGDQQSASDDHGSVGNLHQPTEDRPPDPPGAPVATTPPIIAATDGSPPPSLPPAGAGAFRLPALEPAGLDRQAIIRAVARGDLGAVLRGFGCQAGGGLMPEWRRDADGLSVAMAAVLLGWRRYERDPVRLPSGLRAARERWRALGAEERRRIGANMVGLYGLPSLRPADTGDTPPAAIASG